MTDNTQASILLVEDDQRLAEGVCDTLRRAGFAVTWAPDGEAAELNDVESFELVVLDLMLPGIHGFDLLAKWRQTSDVPVIILTARLDYHDKVRGLELGGDDYMTKPFWPEELLARVRARLRRPQLRRTGGVAIGPLQLDVEARSTSVDGQAIELTRVEFDILALLAERVDQPVTRARLVDRVLDANRDGGERTLDVHIRA
ncbi:MAG: response regulator transcription factor [Myxococcales bacterium FL481]|nr:MAG: response regulator transcription factor [Myxococcales bacterium FL481]